MASKKATKKTAKKKIDYSKYEGMDEQEREQAIWEDSKKKKVV